MRKIYQIILLIIIVFTMSSCLQKESCIEHDYNDKAIRFNMNGTRFDAAHFYGDPYWVVSSAALGKLKYLYLF